MSGPRLPPGRPSGERMNKRWLATATLLGVAGCESPRIADVTTTVDSPARANAVSNGPIMVVNVSDDTTAQNETPLAVNPRNPLNLLTGNNDWNYNDGCGVNVSFDGGKKWT